MSDAMTQGTPARLTTALLLALFPVLTLAGCAAPVANQGATQSPAVAVTGHGAAQSPAVAVNAVDSAPTVVILVRHGEKAAAPANDPVLDSIGTRRAAMLVDVVRDAHVGAVYVTPLARTRLTAEPVARALGVAPIVVGLSGGTAAHVRTVADRVLAEQRGRATLVVGHSNTVPLIVRALGGSAPEQLDDHEYDNLFIVTIPVSGPVVTVRARYGPPNPAPAR